MISFSLVPLCWCDSILTYCLISRDHYNLYEEDFSILDQNRFINLKKLYPYIPDELNNILLNFSGYASNFYLSVDELIDDLRAAFKVIYGG